MTHFVPIRENLSPSAMPPRESATTSAPYCIACRVLNMESSKSGTISRLSMSRSTSTTSVLRTEISTGLFLENSLRLWVLLIEESQDRDQASLLMSTVISSKSGT